MNLRLSMAGIDGWPSRIRDLMNFVYDDSVAQWLFMMIPRS